MPESKTIPRELLLEPPVPMRAQMDEQALNELAASMGLLGVLFPLLVIPRNVIRTEAGEYVECDDPAKVPTGRQCYEIVDGHRRYLAAGIARIDELPCRVFENADDAKFAMMAHANIMREDVTPAEEGLQFLQLAEKCGWGIEQLMQTFKCSENYINDRVALVQGDPEVCRAVATRQIVFGVAKALLKCKEDAHRRYLLQLCITHGANVRTAETYVQQWKQQAAMQGDGEQVHITVAPAMPFTPPEELCLWCCKGTYPEHFERVVIHRWHLDDLLSLLKQVGIHATLDASTEAAQETAQPATSS